MKLVYEIYNGDSYLTAYESDSSTTASIYIKNVSEALLFIGKKAVKIKHNVGSVEFRDLNDGIFDMQLILKDRSLLLGRICISSGTLTPYLYNDAVGFLNRALINAQRRIDTLETEVSRLKDAVYGKKIF